MNKNKKPDLSFEREFGRASEGFEFFLSDDNFLEVQGWNTDSDTFTIILNPDEVSQLLELLIRTTYNG
jgi:hypothetical protein